MQVFLTALSDAALDTLKVLPILYLAYLLVAYFSHEKSQKFTNFLNKSRRAGPLVGAFLGAVPQCGFSSVMSDLYSRRAITLGTLIAVFISTSDEAIPIMIASPNFIVDLLIMIGLKIAFALVFGYLIDAVLTAFEKFRHNRKIKKVQPIDADELEHGHDHCACHGHGDHQGHCDEKNIFIDALYHSCNIALYIFFATFFINVLVSHFGMDGLTSWFGGNIYIQILLAGVIGLIPNCASSVFLVELFINGGISFAAMFAGLCVGAGVGLIILFTKNRGKWKVLENLSIITLLYVLGVASGIVVSFIPGL